MMVMKLIFTIVHPVNLGIYFDCSSKRHIAHIYIYAPTWYEQHQQHHATAAKQSPVR